tara:strand:+ start:2619 stop:3176 length:558 start_codon:yes stop_codon:yes gene_type:complete
MAGTRVASRYAKALLGLASEKNELEKIERDLHSISDLVDASRDFELLLTSPVIKPDKKKAVLESIFKNKISDLTLGFINLLIIKGREGAIPGIVSEGLSQLRKIKKIQAATVKTSTQLDEVSRKMVLAEIAKHHDGDVELTETIDPDLLGGFILRMDDKEIDASIKRQLNTLRRQLTEHDYEPEL